MRVALIISDMHHKGYGLGLISSNIWVIWITLTSSHTGYKD